MNASTYYGLESVHSTYAVYMLQSGALAHTNSLYRTRQQYVFAFDDNPPILNGNAKCTSVIPDNRMRIKQKRNAFGAISTLGDAHSRLRQ